MSYLAALLCSDFKNAMLDAKVQLCSEAHVRAVMAVVQEHLACAYTGQVLNEVGPRDSRAALAPCSASANQPISLKRRLQSCVYTLSRTGGV